MHPPAVSVPGDFSVGDGRHRLPLLAEALTSDRWIPVASRRLESYLSATQEDDEVRSAWAALPDEVRRRNPHVIDALEVGPTEGREADLYPDIPAITISGGTRLVREAMTPCSTALASEYVAGDGTRLVVLRNGGAAQMGGVLVRDSRVVAAHVEDPAVDIVIVESEFHRPYLGVPYLLAKGGERTP